eukprot:10744_1
MASDVKQNEKPLAVITGASKGIGLASALKLIELGYTVVGCARSKHKMQELQKQYKQHDFSVVDMSDASQVSEWSQRILSNYGSPALLLCNAGVGANADFIENVSIKDIDAIINVNVKGVIYTIKHFIGAMKHNSSINSKIIAISSSSGRVGSAQMSPYCASKWAIEGLMLSISKEVPKHMTAIAYNPGNIATDIMYGLIPELKGKLDECIQLGAIGPVQWAEVCIPHMIGLQRDGVNGTPVDRPNVSESFRNNWQIYQQMRQSVLANLKQQQ